MDGSLFNIEFAGDDIDFDELEDLSVDDESAFTVFRDTSTEGIAARNGYQTNSLQSAIDNYASSMNSSAIAKSTGLPVRTPASSYKGFAAEEFFKNTLKINALAQGIPDSKIGVYTKGQLPDGSNLSPIDEVTDISVWTRKHFWDEPIRTVDYQSKIHNNASDYAKDMAKEKYQQVEFVGGSGQGVNDTIKVNVAGKEVTSDAITPEEATELAEQMKAQATPEYTKKQESL